MAAILTGGDELNLGNRSSPRRLAHIHEVMTLTPDNPWESSANWSLIYTLFACSRYKHLHLGKVMCSNAILHEFHLSINLRAYTSTSHYTDNAKDNLLALLDHSYSTVAIVVKMLLRGPELFKKKGALFQEELYLPGIFMPSWRSGQYDCGWIASIWM